MQLKEEAARMDWTRSGSRTLTGHRVRESLEDVLPSGSTPQRSSQKLGGSYLGPAADPRASSVAAALERLLSAAAEGSERISGAAVKRDPAVGGEFLEPDPDDSRFGNGGAAGGGFLEPDPDDGPDRAMTEPDPDDSGFVNGGAASPGTETEESSPFGELEEPAAAICRRLQRALEALRSEAPPPEAASSLHTLLKIIRSDPPP